MSKKLLFSVMIMFLTQGALAHENDGREEGGPPPWMRGPHHHEAFVFPGVLNDRPEPKEGPCADLKLDKGEKTQIKDAYFKFKDMQIDLKAQMEKARLNEEKVASDPNSDFAAAEAASNLKIESLTKLIQADETYRNGVIYKILKPEQRSAARACWRAEHHMHGPGDFKRGEFFKGKHKDQAKSDKDAKKP